MALTGILKVCQCLPFSYDILTKHYCIVVVRQLTHLELYIGNDDLNSPYNAFTVECLDYMGKFSQLAKEKNNYIVAMAPAGILLTGCCIF